MPRALYSPIEVLPERAGPAAAVRTAVLALFTRLGVRPTEYAAEIRVPEEIAPARAGACERAAAERALRRQAHAAYATVVGGGPAALDLALDVLAGEIDTLHTRVQRETEALKAIRLYASEPWVRRIAERVMSTPDRAGPLELPDFLICGGSDRTEGAHG